MPRKWAFEVSPLAPNAVEFKNGIEDATKGMFDFSTSDTKTVYNFPLEIGQHGETLTPKTEFDFDRSN